MLHQLLRQTVFDNIVGHSTGNKVGIGMVWYPNYTPSPGHGGLKTKVLKFLSSLRTPIFQNSNFEKFLSAGEVHDCQGVDI